jgi:predicted RNase H-like HicB family nuclease
MHRANLGRWGPQLKHVPRDAGEVGPRLKHVPREAGEVGSPASICRAILSPGKRNPTLLRNYTARYTRLETGYMGQLLEWPEVITEGTDLEECRGMLRDALNEMILAYQQQAWEVPLGDDCSNRSPSTSSMSVKRLLSSCRKAPTIPRCS